MGDSPLRWRDGEGRGNGVRRRSSASGGLQWPVTSTGSSCSLRPTSGGVVKRMDGGRKMAGTVLTGEMMMAAMLRSAGADEGQGRGAVARAGPEKSKRRGRKKGKRRQRAAPLLNGHDEVVDDRQRSPHSGKEWGRAWGGGGAAQRSCDAGWPAPARSRWARAGGVPWCKIEVAGWLPSGVGPQ
jgi:hypothetical protein